MKTLEKTKKKQLLELTLNDHAYIRIVTDKVTDNPQPAGDADFDTLIILGVAGIATLQLSPTLNEIIALRNGLNEVIRFSQAPQNNS